MISLYSIYKQRYTVNPDQGTRVIDSNELVAKMLEAQRKAMEPEEFTEGLGVEEPEAEIEPEISLEEVRAEAEQILEDARAQAEAILEEARGGADEVTEKARSAGTLQGYEEGQQKAQEELSAEMEKLEGQRQELLEQHRKKLEEMEGQVLTAVCDVMEQMFCIQFDEFGPILLHLVGAAVQQVESCREFAVRVHPKQYDYIEAHRQELTAQVGQSAQIRLEADPSMEESGCIVETDSGFFDCSLDVQFRNLIKAIRMLSI